MAKTVAIVGAGPCGIASVKACVEEGLEPTVFDKRDKTGGIWNYNGDTSDGTISRLFNSLVTNSCTIMTCFSDFPFPKEVPPFIRHYQFLKYFNDYIDHFKLRDRFQLNTEVVRIEQADDYDATGRWNVYTRQLGQEVVMKTFDNVMVCSGSFSEPFIPTVPGMDQYQGEISHTYKYRVSEPYADKTILVVGEAFSACDIAVDMSNPATQVYLSIRHGFWVYPRRGPGGLPYDTFFERRWVMSLLPIWLVAYLYQRYMERDIDYELLGIKPSRKVFEEAFAVNDFVLSQINCGKIKIVPEIKRYLPTGVEFVDGTKLENLDMVMYGTGYVIKTPFIDDSLLSDDIQTRDLYKYAFPIKLPHPTLAAIGLFPPDAGLTPIAEAQARFATMIFQGKLKLPSVKAMKKDIDQKAKELCERYGRPKLFVPGVDLTDELANEMGCYPSLKRLFFRDPRLALQVFLTPVTPFSYRLLGPHPWPGAREAVMNCMEACSSGIRGHTIPSRRPKARGGSWFLRSVVVVAFISMAVAAAFKYKDDIESLLR